ncbi:DUF3616 domain-containing protein [Mesorhizobium sp. AR02]|uniref:DUF3616 domain-containing protein n=1 Tax=Mesorhizobium sp. AR02 TaxID=2865837 RepID=UPI003A5C5E89
MIAGDFVRLIDNSFANKPLELDAEGVAYADGFFYVISSHGRPRHEQGTDDAAKIKTRARRTAGSSTLSRCPLNRQQVSVNRFRMLNLLRFPTTVCNL